MENLPVHFLAGGAAGVTVDAVLYPLDFLKTRLQARKLIVKPVTSMYSGVTSALLGSFPASATFFTTYENLKLYSSSIPLLKVPIVQHAISVTGAEMCACVIRVPFEVIKQQIQVGTHVAFPAAVRIIFKTQGISGFFAGYFSSIAREVPFGCIQFPLWEFLKSTAIGDTTDDLSIPFMSAICGSAAGSVAACITTPFDVIKTRLMTQGFNTKYRGVFDCFRKVIQTEGIRALFYGVVPRTSWICIGGFIFFGSYEMYNFILSRAAKIMKKPQ